MQTIVNAFTPPPFTTFTMVQTKRGWLLRT
jgi:hypothetical protein